LGQPRLMKPTFMIWGFGGEEHAKLSLF